MKEAPPKRVLVMDDDPAIRRVLRTVLEGRGEWYPTGGSAGAGAA